MKNLFQLPQEDQNPCQDKGRWLVLLLLFMTTFGSLFAYDTIGVLQQSLEKALGIDEFQLNLLYNIAIVPNIVLPIISGLIIDRFGIRPTFLAFSIIIAVGQLLVCLGVGQSSFHIVLLGRFIFGLGYQSQYVAKSVLVTRWANSTELSLALSLSAFLSRLGTSFNILASPSIYQDFGISAPFFVGFVLVLFQILLVIVIIYADMKSTSVVDEYQSHHDPVILQDICSFSKPFYILSVGCAISAAVFNCFYQNGSNLLTERFAMNFNQADEMLSLVFMISTFGLPFFGYIADKVSNKLYILPISAFLFIGAAIDLSIREDSPVGKPNFDVLEDLVFYGLFYASFNAVLWSSIPAVTVTTKVGIASGFTISLVEIAALVLPMLTSWVHDGTLDVNNGNFYPTLLYAGIGVIVLGLVIWLINEDKKLGNLLSAREPNFSKKHQVLEMKIDDKFMTFESEKTLAEEL